MRIEDAAILTDPGPRPVNEDGVLRIPELGLFAVADGMGGGGSGDRAVEVAFKLTRDRETVLRRHIVAVKEDDTSHRRLAMAAAIEDLLNTIHRRVKMDASRNQRPGTGVAMTIAIIAGERAYLGHVGNCRAYLFRDGRVRQLTEDHTVAHYKFRHGKLSAAEANSSPERNQLYQVLGQGSQIDIDTAEVPLADGDTLLLCSDGVHSVLDEGGIQKNLGHATADAGARALVEAARRAGTKDNIALCLTRVAGGDAPARVERTARILESVFLFSVLSEASRRMIAPYLEEHRIKGGTVLFKEGDDADRFYMLIEGSARVSKGDTPLVDVGPGGNFGELCLARAHTRSAAVTILEDSFLYSLSRDAFREIVTTRHAVGAMISFAMLDYIGDRLRDLTNRVNTVEQVARGHLRPPGLDLELAVLAAARGDLEDDA